MQDRDQLSQGVFEPEAFAVVSAAWSEAAARLARPGALPLDRSLVARQILAEARLGEVEPELLWRAAVARAAIASRA